MARRKGFGEEQAAANYRAAAQTMRTHELYDVVTAHAGKIVDYENMIEQAARHPHLDDRTKALRIANCRYSMRLMEIRQQAYLDELDRREEAHRLLSYEY